MIHIIYAVAMVVICIVAYYAGKSSMMPEVLQLRIRNDFLEGRPKKIEPGPENWNDGR